MQRLTRVAKVRWRGLLKLGLFVVIVLSANHFASHVVDLLEVEVRPSNEDSVHRLTMLAAAAYAVLIAVPFVPGVEIGLALIAMLGPSIVFLVYVCTVTGLCLAFAAGRVASLNWLAGLLEGISLIKAGALVRMLEPMAQDERLTFLVSNAPNAAIPFLLRHRYVALAVILNMPGNIVIGGGGGLSLMAGASRLYSIPGFLATILLAVAPVPIAILIFGERLLSS
jgi:hypothetical protein